MNTAPENEYPFFVLDNNALVNNIILSKQQILDQQMETISKNLNNLNFKMNTFIEERYNFDKYMTNNLFFQKSMENSEKTNILNKIINEIRKLNDLDDIQDQVAGCAYVCKNTLSLLKNMKLSSEENYSKKLLHLFYQAVKRNYSRSLFTNIQIKLMLDMVEECKKTFVHENVYWEFDEKLYECGLVVFPEEV